MLSIFCYLSQFGILSVSFHDSFSAFFGVVVFVFCDFFLGIGLTSGVSSIAVSVVSLSDVDGVAGISSHGVASTRGVLSRELRSQSGRRSDSGGTPSVFALDIVSIVS